jgi:methylated-DNA-[protein]-cysteine S-methyltransferase
MKLKYKIFKSPVGDLKIVVSDVALMGILWDNEKSNRVKLPEMEEENSHELILETEKQLNDYFLQKRKVFDLPIKLESTCLNQEVWELLNEIPFGSTWSYKDIAVKLNRPKAVRAVGTAIGKNPISIIVPCHRVIGSNGSLIGFAGGLNRKKFLLDLESEITKISLRF